MKKIFLLPIYCLITLSSLAQTPTVGLIKKDTGSEDGYVLFYPEFTTNTYLIDKCGYLVHTWTSQGPPEHNADLLPDGTLLRPRYPGLIERLDWNSNVLWSYPLYNDTSTISHEVHEMPNGNVLAIVWVYKTIPEAINAGFDTSLLQGATLYATTSIEEIKPIGTDSGLVVWQWNAWDHLIQDYDSTKPNYGVVADHPERVNINYITLPPDNGNALELLHTNSVDYNAKLDQIVISNRHISEIWIIDHSTTTTQAATDTGGIHGKGGGILYRWGNPAAYNRGTSINETEFGQHDCKWIDSGLPGAGHLSIFNNGFFRNGPVKYSEADEVITPVDSNGNYPLLNNASFGPDSIYWMDTTPTFYAFVVGSIQRLANGNTLICNGTAGAFYEVDSNKHLLWEYINPVTDSGILYQGQIPAVYGINFKDDNTTYRCLLYEPSYSGLAGHDLTPTAPIERNPYSYTCSTTTGLYHTAVSSLGIKAVNPFNNSIMLLSDNPMSNLTATLTNTLGVVVKRWNNVNINGGINTLLDMDMSLPNAIYFLHISNTQLNTTIKLVCIRGN